MSTCVTLQKAARPLCIMVVSACHPLSQNYLVFIQKAIGKVNRSDCEAIFCVGLRPALPIFNFFSLFLRFVQINQYLCKCYLPMVAVMFSEEDGAAGWSTTY